MPTEYYLGDPVVGSTIDLSVTVNADATDPVLYQWYRDNEAIPGAVGASYSFVVSLDDAHAAFKVIAINPCGEAESFPWLMGQPTTETPVECLPQSCSSIEEESTLLGLGHWPMFDPTGNDTLLSLRLEESGASPVGYCEFNNPAYAGVFYGAFDLDKFAVGVNDIQSCEADWLECFMFDGIGHFGLGFENSPPGTQGWLPTFHLGVAIRNTGVTTSPTVLFDAAANWVYYNSGLSPAVREFNVNAALVESGGEDAVRVAVGSGTTQTAEIGFPIGHFGTDTPRFIQVSFEPVDNTYVHIGGNEWEWQLQYACKVWVGQELALSTTVPITNFTTYSDSPTSMDGYEPYTSASGQIVRAFYTADRVIAHTLIFGEKVLLDSEALRLAIAFDRNNPAYVLPEYCP